ncbi:MAG: DUF3237 family protein [Chloroflexota bacterium]|jgi:hypothetical protein
MSEQAGMPGELIYEYTVQFTQVTEYGVALDTLLSGAAAPPAEGARFDVAFEGPATGPKLKGAVKGVDYLHVRADGRVQLHIHAEITTEDGKKIALAADGVLILEPGSPVARLRENVTLTTSAAEYSWVNPIQVWAPGTVDFAKGEVRIKAYAV